MDGGECVWGWGLNLDEWVGFGRRETLRLRVEGEVGVLESVLELGMVTTLGVREGLEVEMVVGGQIGGSVCIVSLLARLACWFSCSL
jgi:hypothetical protein